MAVGIYMKDVTEEQAAAFRAWVTEKGFTDVVEYRDVTPVRGRSRDRELRRLLDDVREGKLHFVFIISLEQLGYGPYPFLLVTIYLKQHGARLISQSEPWTDLSDQDLALLVWAHSQHTEEHWEMLRRSRSGSRKRKKRQNSGSTRRYEFI